MLYLIFELENDRYALDVRQIVEVLPLLEIKRTPGARLGVAGLFNYHGRSLPLLDVTELNLGTRSQERMSTRIIVCDYVEDSGRTHQIGLLTERVTETIRRSEADFRDSGVEGVVPHFLGQVLVEGNSVIQRVDIKYLLPEDLRDHLFPEFVSETT